MSLEETKRHEADASSEYEDDDLEELIAEHGDLEGILDALLFALKGNHP